MNHLRPTIQKDQDPGPNRRTIDAETHRKQRDRSRGQAKILEMGIAAVAMTSIVGLWSAYRSQNDRQAADTAIADQELYLETAAATFVRANYTAFENYFASSAAAPQILDFPIGCADATCLMPTLGQPVAFGGGTAGWQSLYTAGLIPQEQGNLNAANQTYHLLIRTANAPGVPTTLLNAVLLTEGGPTISDNDNAIIAQHIAPRGGFLPILPANTNAEYAAPAWLTDFARWSIGGIPSANPGYPAITLDYDIGAGMVYGPLQRFSGGTDTRPQTMSRTMYMGSNSVTHAPTNFCFCAASGYYANSCRVPGTAGIPDTPASPNYCGIPP